MSVLEEEFFYGHGGGFVVVTSSISGELFWIFLVDVVEAFADFDRDSFEWLPDFDAFNASCEEDAENVLPVLWIFLGHGGKAIEQNLKEFAVGFVWVFVTKLI